MVQQATISGHTTTSFPRPHVLYVLDVTSDDGVRYSLTKRYSDFVSLKSTLGDRFDLPPKRVLATTFLPSAWVDDALIRERQTGLSDYLEHLLSAPEYAATPSLVQFLAPSAGNASAQAFNPEDALPSTLSRKDALAAAATLSAQASSPIAASYYPDWVGDSNPPESIDFSKFDILFFAFATPSSSNGLNWDDGATSLLQRLVSAANKSGHGTRIVLSVGGWGGCQYFSQVMSSSANRGAFITSLTNAVNQYGLAGIDIDWEYPNESGAGQPYNSADSANLLTFFTYLRKSLGSSKLITATATDLPWDGANGQPLTDVSAYAAQMNYVNLMNYDTWGASSNPGPNAPLSNACGTSSMPQYSAQAGFNQWTAAKFPAGQILLGLPTYGYVSQSSATKLTGSFALPGPPADAPENAHTERVRAAQATLGAGEGDVSTDEPAPPPGEQLPLNFLNNAHDRSFQRRMHLQRPKNAPTEGAAVGDLSAFFNQQIAFNQIVSGGALVASGGAFVQANGYTQAWDNCSDTPFLYNTSRKTVVTYDDTYSLSDKAAFAKSSGMAGCFTWSLDQDEGYALQNAIRSALGK